VSEVTVAVRSGWETKRLDEVADILDNRRVPVNSKERDLRQGSVPYFGATGQVGWIDDHIFDEEIVLLGEDGAPFLDSAKQKAYVVRGKSWVNNHAHVLRAKAGIPSLYLKYWLDRLDYRPYVNGTTRLKLTQGEMRRIPIPLAPEHERYAIVAEIERQFSRLDEAVANLQRVKANLKRYKDSVYAEVFSNEPSCTLGDLIEEGPQNGLYLPKEMYGEGVPILRIDDYQTAWIRPLTELRRVKATPDQICTWALREGDLVINRVNSMTHLGKCALVPTALAGTVFESNMMRMRLKASVSPKYVEHYLASRLGKTRLTENAKWAVNQASINQKDVRATPVFLPDLITQLEVVAEVDRRLSILKGVEIEVDANLKRAQALRQATLRNTFSVKG
jgi:type I restriction enzyme S subunit